jgi:hypothetical protein
MNARILSFACACLVGAAMPAWAVYNQQVVLTGGPGLASAQISFSTDDGQPVTVTTEEDEDRRIAYLTFSGDSGAAGTLRVTSDGATTTYRLPAAAAGQVIRVDTATNQVRLDPAPAAAQAPTRIGTNVSAFYGLSEMEVPSIASGAVLSTDDGERPLSKSDDALKVDTYGMQLTMPLGETGLRAQVVWAHYEGDDDDRAESAPVSGGGIDNAIVFQSQSEAYGTGLNGGLLPLETFGRLEVEGDKFGGGLSWPCAHIENVTGTLGLYYQSTDLDQDQFDNFTTVDVNARRSARVSQDAWIAAFGGTWTHGFNDNVGVSLSAGALLQFYDADLKSTQTIQFFTNPDEVLVNEDDDDAVAFGGYFAAGLPMTFGRLSLTPSFIVETGTVTAAVKYPTSGTAVEEGDEVSLDNDNATNWAALLELGYRI